MSFFDEPPVAEYFVRVRDTLIVSNIVQAVLDDGFGKLVAAEPLGWKQGLMKAEQEVIKDSFTRALEQAVYGNGEKEPVKVGDPTSGIAWKDRLKVGPIGLDKRLEAARAQVEVEAGMLTVDKQAVMEVYDAIAGVVKDEVTRALAKSPAR